MDKKWIERIEWLIVIIVAIMAFSTPILEYRNAPDRMEVEIELVKDIVPINAIPVVNVEGINITGELKPVYDPLIIELETTEAYFSVKDDRKNKTLLIISRGIDTSRNKTYEFRKNLNTLDYDDNLPYYYQNEDYGMGSFEKQKLTVTFFKSAGLDASFCGTLLGALIGIIAIIAINAIEKILEKVIPPVKAGWNKIKRKNNEKGK